MSQFTDSNRMVEKSISKIVCTKRPKKKKEKQNKNKKEDAKTKKKTQMKELTSAANFQILV